MTRQGPSSEWPSGARRQATGSLFPVWLGDSGAYLSNKESLSPFPSAKEWLKI